MGVDLTPTADQSAFRAELRGWLESNLPWEYGTGLPPRFDDLADEVAFLRDWQRRLAEGRWVGVAWPEEYGGRGAGPLEHFIVQEELARARAPELVGRIGVNLAGPTLLAHGSSEQKARWLVGILRADQIWCQLFSEPAAGSDLASVKTRAQPVEGGWVLNGQKVWTSYAQFAEVFLTDVFVPRDQLVGDENNGWRIANSTLSHERGVNPRQLVIHVQLLEELLRLAERAGGYDDQRTRQRLAQAYVEVRLFQLHNWRTLSRFAKGREPGPEGSALKLYWSEMSKRLHDTAMTLLGPAAPLWKGARDNPGDGRWQRSWLYYQASSIWAGTNEIQRNIIGERVLGLPRE